MPVFQQSNEYTAVLICDACGAIYKGPSIKETIRNNSIISVVFANIGGYHDSRTLCIGGATACVNFWLDTQHPAEDEKVKIAEAVNERLRAEGTHEEYRKWRKAKEIEEIQRVRRFKGGEQNDQP